MSKFVLIDHSLVQLGGHHFEYCEHALRAAHAAGHQVTVAAHRNFRKPTSWDPHWEAYSLFPCTLYDELAPHGDPVAAHDESSGTEREQFSLFSFWRTRSERFVAKRQAGGFIRSLRQLFEKVALAPNDHVYLPTVGIFDYLCLAEFLHATPMTRNATWHLQFHYPPAAEQGPAWDVIQSNIRRAQLLTSHHHVHFYATTDGLTEMYKKLGVDCQTLPHHVNPAFVPEGYRRPSDPLRVLCAGCPRNEKGYQHLSRLALDLWQDYFGTGRAQLCLQAKSAFLSPNRPRWKPHWTIADSGSAPLRFQPVGEATGPVAYVKFPLPADDYVKMIRTADVGLFLYDAESYRNRCSGVFVEMLSAGVPVIVPGNSWMAQQVKQANEWCVERFHSADSPNGSSSNRPGHVGLVANSLDDMPQLVREVLDHHKHYRAHAIAFSNVWRTDHLAEATIDRLIESMRHTTPKREVA